MIETSLATDEYTPASAKALFNELLSIDLDQCDVEVCFGFQSHKNENGRSQRKKSDKAVDVVDTPQKPETKETPILYGKLKMTREQGRSFLETFATVLKQPREKAERDDFEFLKYGFDHQTQDQQVEYLHIASYPVLDKQLQPLSSFVDMDLFQKDHSSDVRFYVMIAMPRDGSDPRYLFRVYQRQRFFHQVGGLMAIMQDGTYDLIDPKKTPIYYFDEEVDFWGYKGMLFVNNKAKTRFQNTFHFFESLQKTANEALHAIQTSIPIQHFEQFAIMCQSDPQKLRKLNKIACKPYLQEITLERVKETIAHHHLAVPIAMVDGKEQIVYDEKDAHARWVILNLLDDNYLDSLMTGRNYLAVGKQEV